MATAATVQSDMNYFKPPYGEILSRIGKVFPYLNIRKHTMNIHTVKVTFNDGDYFYTKINADEQTIRRYYVVGSAIGIDDGRKIASVEVIN